MKIVLIDDHPLVTATLSDRLRALGHETSVCDTLEEARRFLLARSADLCILDIDLGGQQGTDLLADPALAGRLPPRIVILSGKTDRDEIAMSLDDGAHAFVMKNIPFDDVIAALVAAAEMPCAGEPVVWLQEERGFKPASELFRKGIVLSPRERDVFRLLRQGLSDKAIATELDRSIHTIRVQIRSIMRKRGTSRRGEHY